MTTTSATILRFLQETVDPTLTLETELLESGLMDSFKAITLIAFLETEFELRVQPSDLTRADLATASAISRFVEQLQGHKPAPL